MGKHVKFSMETQRDSVWNTLWNFHGYSVKSQGVSKTPWSLRGVLIWFGWREITMENVVFHGNSKEYSTCNPMECPSKISHIFLMEIHGV